MFIQTRYKAYKVDSVTEMFFNVLKGFGEYANVPEIIAVWRIKNK